MSSPKNTSRIDRRSVLKGIGGAGLAGAGLAGGMALTSQPVAAADFTIGIGDTEVETADGELSWIAKGVQGMVTWEYFSQDIDAFDWYAETDVLISGESILDDGPHVLVDIKDRDFEGGFDRPIDSEDASGQDGHLTWHLPNPDGSYTPFTGGEQGTQLEDGDNEWENIGPAWVIVQDEEFRDALEAEDSSQLEYDLPLAVEEAVDAGYDIGGFPGSEGAIHMEQLADDFPDDGESTRFQFRGMKRATMYAENNEEMFEVEADTRFDVVVENVDGEFNIVAEGESGAGPSTEDL